MRIMGQAVIAVVVKSIPKVPRVSPAERARCLDRAQLLRVSFEKGLCLLTTHCKLYRKVITDADKATAGSWAT